MQFSTEKTSDPQTRWELILKCSALSHKYSKAVKRSNIKCYAKWDSTSNLILSKNPSQFYQCAWSVCPKDPSIDKLEACSHTFHGPDVLDGFFLSMTQFKNPTSQASSLPHTPPSSFPLLCHYALRKPLSLRSPMIRLLHYSKLWVLMLLISYPSPLLTI